MNPELERLMLALKRAHAAGDVASATRLAQMIRARQSTVSAPADTAPADTAPTPDYERAVANDGWRDVPPPVKPASPVQGGTFGGMGGFAGTGNGAGREFGGPRETGREVGAGNGVEGAVNQGVGSALLGAGVPVTAVGEFMRSRAEGKPRSWNQAMEYARGVREGSVKEHPYAYGAGNVLGIAAGGAAATSALSKAPAVVKTVFSLQKGQTARNLMRIAATGAATAGATAGMQEGTDAVVPAAEYGAGLGLAGAAALHGALGLGRAVMARIDPENAAVRALAKRFKESASNIATLYNDFMARTGRRPGLAEIVSELEAGRVGQVGAQYSEAGQVFRNAEEVAANARPRELQNVVEKKGYTLTVPEQTAELPPIEAEARRAVNSRVRSTAQAQLARRNNAMDAVMGRIGDEPVHATDAMKDILEHVDVQQAMPPILRRRINDAIANGMDVGSIDIPLHIWEKMRFEMGKKAGGPGASQFYSDYRRRIADYVSGRVPEYGRALLEYGRRSVGAEATAAAESGASGSAREFADALRIAGGETHGVTARATTRVGLRNWLSKQMQERPRRVLERLGRDSSLRDNVRAALSQNEVVQLEALGEQYGRRLNIIQGIKTGQNVVRGDAENFADAVATARAVPGGAAGVEGGAAGVEGGARGALAAKVGESPASAVATSAALAKHPGLQDRIAAALGAPEAARLQRAGESFTQSARNLRSATPATTQAQQEAAEQASKIYNVITGTVTAMGNASGALKAHLVQRMVSRVNLGSKAAVRLAELATDPARAPEAIRLLRQAGVREAEILQWYQAAAAAAGITTGANLSDSHHR